ncbi:MAG: hypothetical protein WAW23_08035 [Candidatus Methanoperedens sp.]
MKVNVCISENDLRAVSNIIINGTYPNETRYNGWFSQYPIRLSKEKEEYFNLDFGKEKDIIALIFLATIWNMPNYKWENAAGLIVILYKRDLVNIKEWCNRSFIDGLNKETLEREMNELARMACRKEDSNLHKRGNLYIKKGKDGVFERLHKIACEYEYLKDILRIDEILKGHKPQINPSIFDRMNDKRLKIEINGKNGKVIRKPLIRVKVPLILRELKCSDRINIADEYCCVPDTKVKGIMKTIGFPYYPDFDTNSVIENSKIISKYFNYFYDLPLFDFADNCKKEKNVTCTNNTCAIFNYCAKNN